MEVWWTGFIVRPERLILYILASFVLLLGYNRYAGLHRDASWQEVVIDSVEEMAIGLVLAGGFLLLLGRILPDMHIFEITGKVVMEGMTVAIGVSVGTAQLGGGDEDAGDEYEARDEDTGLHPVLDIDEIVIAFCAAVLIGGNLAPTEEILLIGIEISTWSMIGLVIVSLLIGVMILFYSEFTGSRELPQEAPFVAMASRGFVTYAVALAAATMTLWFFGRFDGVSFITGLSQTIVLGVATTLGASAGRLLLR